MTLEEYVKERDKVLLTRDVSLIMEFAANHGVPFNNYHVAEIAMHKMFTATKYMPHKMRMESAKWLVEQGYRILDDGELWNELTKSSG